MSTIERLFQGSLFFVSGAGIILAIVGIVYCISWCYDSASGEDLLTPNELEERRIAPILVRQAGLAGLLKEEQTKIIKYHFEANSFPYVKQATPATKENNIEAQVNNTEEEAAKMEPKTRDDRRTEKSTEAEDSKGTVDKEIIEEQKEDEVSADDYVEKESEEVNETTDAEKQEGEGPDIEESKDIADTEESIDQAGEQTDDESPGLAETEHDGNKEVPDVEVPGSKTDTDQDEGDKDENEVKKDAQESSSKDTEKLQTTDVEEKKEEGGCSICIGEYETGEKVIIGSSCGHMFHLPCFMEWVAKNHMDCPICRSDMITPDEFVASAYQVVGERRVDKIRNINEVAASRLEAKIREETQSRQQAAAALESNGGAPVATVEADIEKGEVKPNADSKAEGRSEPESDPEAETEIVADAGIVAENTVTSSTEGDASPGRE